MAESQPLVDKQRYTNVIFTWNNYTPQNEEKLKKLYNDQFPLKVKFMQYGHELAGTTGTPHLQGFIQFGGRYTLSTILKWSGTGVYWAICRGSLQDNLEYTSKEQRDVITLGTPHPMSRADPDYGTRSEFKDAIEKATTMKELATSFRGTFVRYNRGFQALFRTLRQDEPKIKPIVMWFAGPTGCGKTRTAYEEALARGTVWFSPSSKMDWFDGYDGHDTAIFDDFRASGNRFSYILKILDRYPLDVPVKGGFVQWNPKYIVFTCPRPPEEEFVNRETGQHYEDLKQLIRRVDETRIWLPQLKVWQIIHPPTDE